MFIFPPFRQFLDLPRSEWLVFILQPANGEVVSLVHQLPGAEILQIIMFVLAFKQFTFRVDPLLKHHKKCHFGSPFMLGCLTHGFNIVPIGDNVKDKCKVFLNKLSTDE